MKKIHHKGAVEIGVLFTLFGIIILAFVTYALLAYVYGIEDKTYYEATYISRDMSSLISSISIVPGNILVPYTKIKVGNTETGAKTSKYLYSFENGQVVVSPILKDENKNNQQAGKRYRYWFNSNYINKLGRLEKPNNIVFEKNGNIIEIKEEPKNLNMLRCDSFSRKGRKILIDYSEKEGEYKDIPKRIAGFLSDLDYSTTIKIKNDKIALKSAVSDADILVRIETGENNYQMDIIKFFYPVSLNKLESKALACNIINEALLTNEFEHIQGVQLIPLDLSEISKDDELQIFSDDKIGVIIQLGNTKYNDEKNLLKESRNLRQFVNIIDKVIKQ